MIIETSKKELSALATRIQGISTENTVQSVGNRVFCKRALVYGDRSQYDSLLKTRKLRNKEQRETSLSFYSSSSTW